MTDESTVRRMARRRYWREADARIVLEGWRASGSALREFCEKHGLSRQRVARWASRVSRPPQALRFHPVRVVDPGRGPAEQGLIEIELRGGETIRLPPSFALEDLRHVFEALGERERC